MLQETFWQDLKALQVARRYRNSKPGVEKAVSPFQKGRKLADAELAPANLATLTSPEGGSNFDDFNSDPEQEKSLEAAQPTTISTFQVRHLFQRYRRTTESDRGWLHIVTYSVQPMYPADLQFHCSKPFPSPMTLSYSFLDAKRMDLPILVAFGLGPERVQRTQTGAAVQGIKHLFYFSLPGLGLFEGCKFSVRDWVADAQIVTGSGILALGERDIAACLPLAVLHHGSS